MTEEEEEKKEEEGEKLHVLTALMINWSLVARKRVG